MGKKKLDDWAEMIYCTQHLECVESDLRYLGGKMTYLNPVEGEAVAKEKTYKVPIFKKATQFVVWAGQGAVRYFEEDELPDFLKVKLGVVMASPHAPELNQKEMNNTDFEQSNMQNEVYTSKFGKDYEDVGWQYNKYYYCVVISEAELKIIQEGNDTGAQSQSKG